MGLPTTNSFRNYFMYLSVLTIILLVVYYFVRDQLPWNAVYIVPSFYVITAGAHYLLQKSLSKEPRKFYLYFMSAMAFKILAYLLVLTVIALTGDGINFDFVVAFFSVYLCYTVFEMIIILPRARRNS